SRRRSTRPARVLAATDTTTVHTGRPTSAPKIIAGNSPTDSLSDPTSAHVAATIAITRTGAYEASQRRQVGAASAHRRQRPDTLCGGGVSSDFDGGAASPC